MKFIPKEVVSLQEKVRMLESSMIKVMESLKEKEYSVELLHEDAVAPTLGSDEAAGRDFRTIESGTIPPGLQAVFRTAIAMSLPVGHVGLIWSRSKLAIKLGIEATCMIVCKDTGKIMAGVVDSDYRGEIMIALRNTSSTPVEIRAKDKIAQMIIQKHSSNMKQNIVDELDRTMRGKEGINSSEMRLR